MEMQEGEIYKSYMEAADRKKQINILAQLNACGVDEIKEMLVKRGRPAEEIYPPKRKRRTKAEIAADAKKKAEKEKEKEAQQMADTPIGGVFTGEESNDGSVKLKRYRIAEELENEPDDMTEREKERLKNIRAIPEVVREILKEERKKLHKQVMEIEAKTDAITDFLNGEQVS